MEELKSQYESDSFLQADRLMGPASRLIEQDGVFFHRVLNTIYVPKAPSGCTDYRTLFIQECHKSALSGHFGTDKVVALLSQHFWWPRLHRDVQNLVRCCHECQLAKPTTHLKHGLAGTLPVPSRCWQHVSMDLVTALPTSRQGNDSIFVLVDSLSKMAHFVPCKKKISTRQIANLFVKDVVRLHGWPEAVISDRDPRFDADFWRALLDGSGTKLCMSTPYHPETDGQTERANRTILQMLRTFCVTGDSSSWEDQLPWLEFAYNSSEQATTGLSPFYLNHGCEPSHPLNTLFTDSCPKVHDDSPSGRGFTKRLNDALLVAKTNLANRKKGQAATQNRRRTPNPFQPGDWATVDKEVFRFPDLLTHKLKARYKGPYLVMDCDEHTLLLRTPLDENFHAKVNVGACQRYIFPPGEEPPVLPPSFIDHDTVELSRIVGERTLPHDKRKKEYRCRLRYPPHNTPEHDRWFLAKDLSSRILLKRYKADLERGSFVHGEFIPDRKICHQG